MTRRIKAHPIRLGCVCHPQLLDLGQDEAVDRVPDPAGLLDRGGQSPFHGLIGPVLALLCRKRFRRSVIVRPRWLIAGQSPGGHDQEHSQLERGGSRSNGHLAGESLGADEGMRMFPRWAWRGQFSRGEAARQSV